MFFINLVVHRKSPQALKKFLTARSELKTTSVKWQEKEILADFGRKKVLRKLAAQTSFNRLKTLALELVLKPRSCLYK